MAIGAVFGAVGSLAGGVMGAIGDEQAASEYRRAARMEQGAATLTAQQFFPQASAAWIKMQQTSHQVFSTIGQQVSQVGGAGFKQAGTNTAILSSSMRQGNLAITAQALQGQENMQSLIGKAFSEEEQIMADKAMAKKEETAAIGSAVGGVLGAAGGLFGAFGKSGE